MTLADRSVAAPQRSLATWAWVLAAGIGLLLLLALPELGRWHPDAEAYRAMARLDFAAVDPPFVKRPLAPLAAWALTRLGLSADSAFLGVTLAALALFLGSLLACWRRWGLPLPALALCLLPVPALVQQVETTALTDLPSWALTALCLALLLAGRDRAAALVLLPAFACRPGPALVLALAVAVVLLRRRAWPALGLAAAAALGGEALVALAASHGQPDKYGLAAPLYLLLKLANNAAQSYLGLGTWSNLHAWCAEPVWRATLPDWLPLGRLGEVGLCRQSLALPSEVLLRLTTLFGLLPGALLALAGGRLRRLWRERPDVAVVLVYGLAMALLGPMTGNATIRLVFQGWPAFLLALPFLLSWRGLDSAALWRLGAAHLALCWLPQLLPLAAGDTAAYWYDPGFQAARLALAGLGAAANLWVWRALRRRLPPGAAHAPDHRAVAGRERNVT